MTMKFAALFVLGIVPFVQSAGAAKYSRDRAQLLALADPATSGATWRSMISDGAVEEYEGLIVAGAAAGHERATARRFGHYLHRKFGLRLVLMSKVARMTVPAFDGLVVNDRDEVVANVSMKRTTNRFNFRGSHSKITGYNQIERWVDNLLLHQSERPEGVIFVSADHLAQFEERARVVRDVAKVFGVGTPRQTWMLMEYIAHEPLGPERIAEFASREASWNEHVSRILVIDDTQIFDVKPARTRPGTLEGCERFLIEDTAHVE